MLKSLFNKFAGQTTTQVFSCEICNTYLRTPILKNICERLLSALGNPCLDSVSFPSHILLASLIMSNPVTVPFRVNTYFCLYKQPGS